jgi:hypothetical protein
MYEILNYFFIIDTSDFIKLIIYKMKIKVLTDKINWQFNVLCLILNAC